jgi:adenylosuccinate synthase
MTNRAVIGLGFGDEGKGVVTEYLCSQDPDNTIVVRFSGGQQAGHKVIKGDVEHVFHNFGSGTLSGCPTYWSSHCTFNPWTLWIEYLELLAKGIRPQLYIHSDCAVTTHGIFRTKERHKVLPIRVADLLTADPQRLDSLMVQVREYYDAEPMNMGIYWDAVWKMRQELGSVFHMDRTYPLREHSVFEGSQGLMLDEHIGHMPHCTPSDITPRNILKHGLDEIFLVTRAYQTRHGKGPMTNEKYPVRPLNDEKETNVCNKWQGEFRSTMLDLEQLVHAKSKGIDEIVPKNTKISLVVTCIDQLPKYSFTQHGRRWDFDSYKNFVLAIQYQLRINGDVYINTSPHSSSISYV